MAAGIIDWARVVLLIQHTMLNTAALTSEMNIARQHEASSQGSDMPAVKVLGMLRWESPHRRGGGTSGNEPAESTGTLGLLVRYRIDTNGRGQMGLEGALSLLEKHLCDRTIENVTSSLGSGGNIMAASGHLVELWGARVEQAFEGEDERDRIAVMEIDVRVTRTASSDGLLIEA
jgi:hypothetical protein